MGKTGPKKRREKPGKLLPRPGSLDNHPPKERRPLHQMDSRKERVSVAFGKGSQRVSNVWDSYTFDALFRLALGMILGFTFGVMAVGTESFGYIEEDHSFFADLVLLLGLVAPPTGALIHLAFRWRKRFKIRKWLFPKGLAFGLLHASALSVAFGL